MALNIASFAAAMKTIYTKENIENMSYTDHPLMALISKDTNFKGDLKKIPVITSNAQGQSADFATAKANKSDVQTDAFFISRVKNYGIASVDNETMLATEGDSGAFLEAFTTQVDSVMRSVSNTLAVQIYRSGSGSIGQVAAINTLVLTLASVESVTNFERGMNLNLSTADGGGSVKAQTPVITAVDRDNGTITVDSATGIAVNDYLFIEGNYDKAISGLQAWLPITVSGADNFFTVNRSKDKTRLAGVYFDGSAGTMEEAMINAAHRLGREGGKASHVFMNHAAYAQLLIEVGSKVQRVDLKATATISFPGLELNGPRGVLKIVADADCPAGEAYMLDLSTWKLESLKPAPHIINQDGMESLRDSDADSVEFRIGYYAQVSCKAPGRNCRIKLPA